MRKYFSMKLFSLQSIIFYVSRSVKLEEWLSSETINKSLEPMADGNFIDLDPNFNAHIDGDFDVGACGMTKAMFWNFYGDWITFCAEKCQKNIETGPQSALALLCFALSLLGKWCG